MRILHVVTSTFGLVNSLASSDAGPADEHAVLVLFHTDPRSRQLLVEAVGRLVPGARARLLGTPSSYVRDLGSGQALAGLMEAPDEVRMHHTHNTWLHDALLRACPGADVVLVEEGMASYYPGLLQRHGNPARIREVASHEYLDVFSPDVDSAPATALRRVDPRRFRELVAVAHPAGEARDAFPLDLPVAVLSEQYLFKKGTSVSAEALARVYAGAVTGLVERGFGVQYKKHPRESTDLAAAVGAMVAPHVRERLQVLGDSSSVLEASLGHQPPAAVVGISSTSLLTAPHLYGVPSFRIPTDLPLQMAATIPVESQGLAANHLALLGRLASTEEITTTDPTALSALASTRAAAAGRTVDDPVLRAVARTAVSPGFLELLRLVLGREADVVSFDLFDTLVDRPAMAGSDLFALGDRAAAAHLAPAVRFSNARATVFQRMRASYDARNRAEEVDLTTVYAYLQRTLCLQDADRDALRDIELALEREHLRARPAGVVLYGAAGLAGHRRAVTTDTYLDRDQLQEVALHHLPEAPDHLLVSSEAGVTKRSGGLFAALVEVVGTPPDRLLHIGDRTDSDVEPARRAGLRAEHLPSPQEAYTRSTRSGRHLAGLRHEKGEALVQGMIARRLCSDPFSPADTASVSGGDAWRLGYAVVGPAVLHWVRWLHEQSRLLGVDRLLFLSRDGHTPLAVHRRLEGVLGDLPEARYTYASRQTAMAVFASTPGHVALTEFVHGMGGGVTPRSALAHRFGTGALELLAAPLAAVGITQPDVPVGRRLAAFKAVIGEHSAQLAALHPERSALARDYYRAEVEGSARPAVVDIGYSGSSQRSVVAATGRPVAGLYFTRMEHNVEHAALMGLTSLAYTDEPVFFTDGAFLEYLVTPGGLPPTLGFHRRGDGTVGPALGEVPLPDPVKDRVQRGVLEFVDDAVDTFGSDLDLLGVRPPVATRMLRELFTAPGEADLALFRGAVHEDSIGAARESVLDYWTAARGGPAPPAAPAVVAPRSGAPAFRGRGVAVRLKDVAYTHLPPATARRLEELAGRRWPTSW